MPPLPRLQPVKASMKKVRLKRPFAVAGFCGALLLTGCASPPAAGDSEFLYLWTAAPDSNSPDFLAVFDVHPDIGRYGALVGTVEVTSGGNRPHHTEHSLAQDQQLFANGFGSGRSFIFDLRDPAKPRLTGQFAEQAGMHHPH